MTKVCHMTSAHAPGDTRIFYKECVSLAKAGYEVYLVERGESYEESGVHVIGLGQPSGGRLSRMTSFAKKVYSKALELDADIYHFHDPELLPYGLKLKKQGKKVIFDSHERYTEQLKNKSYLPTWVSRTIAAVYDRYERSVLKRLDAVIFPCTMDGRNPFDGLCDRSVIISNAAILGEFFDKYDPKTEKLDRAVCYVGGLTQARGITADVQAAAQAQARLVLAGAFSSREYQMKLEAMPEYTCVDYRGTLGRDGIAEVLAQCQAGLCTLKDVGQYLKIDTFGIKVYEYMSMGLPVILSHSSYNDRMMEQYRFGICVDPDDVEEVAASIRYLLDHPEEARQMGENGRRAVQEKFNWGVEERKLLDLYAELTGELPRGYTKE